MPKIESKHLVFKDNVAEMKTRLLIDNSSKAELIDKSFVRTQEVNTFKLKMKIKLTLGNKKEVQKLESACLIDVHIRDHHKQILCFATSLKVYSMILGDRWLQTHNPAIDWKNCTMRFNSAACIESGCLSYGVPCVKFAINSKAKNRIGVDKLTAVDPGDIDIKPVNAKYFFQIAQKRDHKSYIWIPQVLSTDCTNKKCTGSSSYVAKWCANSTNEVAQKDYSKFMNTKPEYTKEDLLKRVFLEYHSIIEVFIKSNADKVAEHQDQWDHKIYLKDEKD